MQDHSGQQHQQESNEQPEPVTGSSEQGSSSGDGKIITLPIFSIKRDERLKMRETIPNSVVKEYARLMKAGVKFPPVVVFKDRGGEMLLASGNLRMQAAEQAGLTQIEVEVRSGTFCEALLFAAGENATHGQRRTTKDKHLAVRKLLDSKDWEDKSDRWIADAARVSAPLVSKIVKKFYPDRNNAGPKLGKDLKKRNFKNSSRKKKGVSLEEPTKNTNDDKDSKSVTETVTVDLEERGTTPGTEPVSDAQRGAEREKLSTELSTWFSVRDSAEDTQSEDAVVQQEGTSVLPRIGPKPLIDAEMFSKILTFMETNGLALFRNKDLIATADTLEELLQNLPENKVVSISA